MKTLDTTKNVEDTPENFEICKKYCGSCPTYKSNKLSAYPPNALFCARGKSTVPSQVKQEIKKINCYCPACEIFIKCGLTIGYFCAKHWLTPVHLNGCGCRITPNNTISAFAGLSTSDFPVHFRLLSSLKMVLVSPEKCGDMTVY